MSAPTLVISDLHMGSARGCAINNPADLRPLWENCGQLIINGDAAELQDARRRAQAQDLVHRLLDLAQRDGVSVRLLAGNHDPHISPDHHALAAHDRILITHGDAFHPHITPWCPYAHELRTVFQSALAAAIPHSGDTLPTRFAAVRQTNTRHWEIAGPNPQEISATFLLRKPQTVWHVLNSWRIYPRLAAQFAARFTPSARVILFGHMHRAGVWRVADRLVINTGCFGFPTRPLTVTFDDQALHVWHTHRTAAGWVRQKKATHTFPLHDVAPAPVPPGDLAQHPAASV